MNASSGTSAIDFNLLAGNYSNSSGLVVGPVTFTGYEVGASYNLHVKNDTDYPYGSGGVLKGPSYFNAASRIEVALPAGVYSVSSDIMSWNGAGQPTGAATFQIQLSTGALLYPAPTPNNFASRGFFGFTSDTAITSVSIFAAPGGSNIILDNFSYGALAGGGQQPPAETPEAASLILCATGVFFLFLRRKRIPELVVRSLSPARAEAS
ncbi:MAG: hypothetical protein ACRD8O_04260 [Bryobacteraceae bacterium]